MNELMANDVLTTCILAWVVAQLTKPLIQYVHSRRVSLLNFVPAGGMPSSPSAVVVALAARVGVDTGLSSIPFALAAVFAAVVMYDAAGVRRAVSLQARVLNRMLTEMLEAQHLDRKR